MQHQEVEEPTYAGKVSQEDGDDAKGGDNFQERDTSASQASSQELAGVSKEARRRAAKAKAKPEIGTAHVCGGASSSHGATFPAPANEHSVSKAAFSRGRKLQSQIEATRLNLIELQNFIQEDISQEFQETAQWLIELTKLTSERWADGEYTSCTRGELGLAITAQQFSNRFLGDPEQAEFEKEDLDYAEQFLPAAPSAIRDRSM